MTRFGAMKPGRGSVVLLPFPFAELTATKVRPAVVVSSDLYHREEPDLLVVPITSNIQAHGGRLDTRLENWREAGLKAPSVVKSCLATLSPDLIRNQIGQLHSSDLARLDQAISLSLNL